MNKRENKKNVYKRLNEGEKIRVKEELTRPRVEVWIDEDAAWLAFHEGRNHDKRFTEEEGLKGKARRIKIMKIMSLDPKESDCLDMLRLLIEKNAQK